MAYKITSSDSNRIVLDREGTGCASALFIIVGAIFVCAGVFINFTFTTWEFPLLLARLMPAMFGVFAIAMGLYLPRQTRNTIPQQIIFDHTLGAVIIEMMIPSTDTGYIPYNEIQEFDIHVEHKSSEKGRTQYRYHVLIRKKDGGEWFLTNSDTKPQAEEIQNQLRSVVNLNQPYRINGIPRLSNKIERQEGVDRTIIHWQNKVAWAALLFLCAFFSIFATIAGTLYFGGNDLGIFPFLVLGFIFFVFFLIAITVVRKAIKDLTTRYAVAVGLNQLEYYEFSKSNGVTKATRIIPLNEIINVTYSFSPVKMNATSALTLLTSKDLLQIQDNKDKPLRALKAIFKGNEKAIELSIAALNPVECLQLETWLQELIKTKGGKAL